MAKLEWRVTRGRDIPDCQRRASGVPSAQTGGPAGRGQGRPAPHTMKGSVPDMRHLNELTAALTERMRREHTPHDPTDLAVTTRRAALYALTGLTVVADLGAFAESANGVYHWGLLHGLSHWRAIGLPAFVDVFIAIGELGLFSLMFWGHRWWHRLGAWLVTLTGLAASVAANMGDVWTLDWPTRITYAVPPVAAAAALYVGLSVLKRIIAVHRSASLGGAADPAGVARPVQPSPRLATSMSPRPGKAKPPKRPARAGALVGAEAALYNDAVQLYQAGVAPLARSMARTHLGSDSRKRRAGTLIDMARRAVQADDEADHYRSSAEDAEV